MRELWAAITTLMTSWHEAKLFIEHAVTIQHDALHMIAGLILWLVICRLSGRPVLNWPPFLWTFAAAAWNEAVDLWTEIWPEPGRQFGEGVKDLVLTLAGPLIVMAAVRLWPRLFQAPTRRGDEEP